MSMASGAYRGGLGAGGLEGKEGLKAGLEGKERVWSWARGVGKGWELDLRGREGLVFARVCTSYYVHFDSLSISSLSCRPVIWSLHLNLCPFSMRLVPISMLLRLVRLVLHIDKRTSAVLQSSLLHGRPC